jgi:hypothetical protein
MRAGKARQPPRDGGGVKASMSGSGLSRLYRIVLTMAWALPIYPQLRTSRCAVITDALGQSRRF